MGILSRVKAWLLGKARAAGPVPSPEAYFADRSNWSAVTSSNVKEIAYFLDVTRPGENILAVRFLGGGEYWYYGPELSVFTSMLASSSKGRYVWQSLRDRYPYKRVR